MTQISTVLLATFAAIAATPSLAASAARIPASVGITSIIYAGTGCPAGSLSANVAADRQATTLSFDGLTAEVGPGVDYAARRKNCQMAIVLKYPRGWTYAVADVTMHGYASLADDTTGTLQTSLYFQGQSTTQRVATSVNGPTDGEVDLDASMAHADQVWAPCNVSRALNVNLEVRVSGSEGLLTAARDGGLGGLDLVWKRCH